MIRKIVLLCLAILTSIRVSAYDFSAKNEDEVTIYYNITSSTTCEVSYDDEIFYTGIVNIPESVTYNSKTYSVTSIGDWAFGYCTELTSVTIPNSVTRIGEEAFCECIDLTSIEIPNSIKSIGNSAFEYCIGLKSIEIPNSVTSIEIYAFWNCIGLESITIPNSVTSIKEWAFWNCSSLESVSIPNSVKSIGERAFGECSDLISIDIPNSVTSIGECAFEGCSGLKSIVVNEGNKVYDSRDNCNAIIETATNTLISGCMNTIIPNSVTSIGNGGFSGCLNLTSIDIPNSVTRIGDSAFERNGFASITLPNSVISIGKYAFYSCTTLASIEIPNSMTSIGESAFCDCTALASIIIDKDNKVYDSRDNCNAIIETATNTLISGCMNTIIPNSVTTIGGGAFSGCTALTSIDIPNSVTSIGKSAFDECSGLTSVTIGNSVANIEQWAFTYCSALSSIIVNKENKVYDSRNNCNAIIETATNTLILGCANTIIPNSVTKIGEYAFEGNNNLTSINIPNSVTSIGEEAFYGCHGLTSIDIPNSVKSIKESAFAGCWSLASVTIGNSVTNIEYYAFYSYSDLVSVTNLATEPQQISSSVFTNYGTLHVLKGYKDVYAADNVWSNFTIVDDAEDPTGIKVSNDNRQLTIDNSSVFDLQGKRVEHMKQGNVYIRDGHKFIAK